MIFFYFKLKVCFLLRYNERSKGIRKIVRKSIWNLLMSKTRTSLKVYHLFDEKSLNTILVQVNELEGNILRDISLTIL